MRLASTGHNVPAPGSQIGIRIDLGDPEAALATILAQPDLNDIAAVIGTDDATGELAALAAHALGLPHNDPAAMRTARRKDLARQATASTSRRTPMAILIDLTQPLAGQVAAVRYPCVVKPLALAASRGVIRANDSTELMAAVARVARLLEVEFEDGAERRQLLVEDFISGVEVAVEAVLSGGRLEVLAIFDKPDPLDGPYFEETYYVTPTRLTPAVQEAVRREVAKTCASYGLREGPVHAECRINARGVWVLEAAARTIGGDCARLFAIGTGRTLEDVVLANAMGHELRASRLDEGLGVLMIPVPGAGVLRRVEGIGAALRVPYVEHISIDVREGHLLVPWPEGSSYPGFIFARAPTAVLAEAALREAHRCLNFVVAPLMPLAVAQ